MASYALVLLVALLNICSISLFKSGVRQAGGITLGDLTNPLTIAAKIVTTPLLVAGICTSVCTTILWLATLTRLPASTAVPLMNGVFYVLLLSVSVIFLGEHLGTKQLVAIALIAAGMFMLARA